MWPLRFEVASSATSAESAEQLRLEIATLQGLEAQALEVLRSGEDTKWTQLDRILDDELMRDPKGNRRKLIIFTEPKDTLFYLRHKVTNRIGRQDAVEVIHGGVTRDERRKIVERFMTDKDLLVLIANDAAGEGVNLQRGHLMVNYDLPWNLNSAMLPTNMAIGSRKDKQRAGCSSHRRQRPVKSQSRHQQMGWPDLSSCPSPIPGRHGS